MANDTQLQLAKQDFRKELNKLEKANKNIPQSTELQKVDEKGLFGVNKKVKGADFNALTDTLQDVFSEIYQTERELIKEFDGVYKTLDKLDDEYIKAIMISVNDAKTASDQAKAAGKRAEKALAEVQATLETQSALIEKIKDFKDNTAKNIKVLNAFRTEIEKVEHYADIDQIWEDVENLLEEKKTIEKNLNKYSKDFEGLKKDFNTQKNKFAKLKHLEDIDAIWDNNQKLLEDLKNVFETNKEFEETLERNNQTITEELNLLRENQKQILEDNENYFVEISKRNEEFDNKFAEINLKDDEMLQEIDKSKESEEALKSIIDNQKQQIEKLSLFLKVIAITSGVGIVTAIVSIIMNVVG